MVEEDRYCIDVIEQITVAKRTLDGVAVGLVDGHIRTCMSSPEPAERETRAGELMAVVSRLVKTS
jgi:DNA-binding FrmR family transcriptional regulator